MLRLALKLSVAAAAAWAVFTYVPVRDRTLAQRWAAAPTPGAFLERGLAELGRALRPAPARPQARSPAARERPTEGHTEADRRAIDRLVAEQLDERG